MHDIPLPLPSLAFPSPPQSSSRKSGLSLGVWEELKVHPAGSGVEPKPPTHFCGITSSVIASGDNNFGLLSSVKEVKFQVQ